MTLFLFQTHALTKSRVVDIGETWDIVIIHTKSLCNKIVVQRVAFKLGEVYRTGSMISNIVAKEEM